MPSTTTILENLRTSIPSRQDPRWAVACLLLAYLCLGVTVLGFNRDPATIALIIVFACVVDMVLHSLLRGGSFLFPLSAAITGMSLSILLNYGHGSWLPLIAVFAAIASKYVITLNGRHLYNPALFAIVICLLFSDGLIAPAPAYQWGGTASVSVFIATCAIFLFVVKINRIPLVVSFLSSFIVFAGVRAWLTQWHVPPVMIFMGAASSPAFYLFTFFMLTDPKTSPDNPRHQVVIGFSIAFIDLLLHKIQLYNTHFYAAFIVISVWSVINQVGAYRAGSAAWLAAFPQWLKRLPVVLAGFAVLISLTLGPLQTSDAIANFSLERIEYTESGLTGRPSKVLEEVDPRVRHIAKWMLSIGDAVAINDFDDDGYLDVFLTNSLKDVRDRAALYRNIGGFRFERVSLPELTHRFAAPQLNGLPSGALWFDYDNDGDDDLLVLTGYGGPVLLENRLIEDGEAGFRDVTANAGLQDYLISVTANALDIDNDGHLDLVIGNLAAPYFGGYEKPTRFNLFDLPEPAYPGDRRMYNFMHRSWHDANNGGRNLVYLGNGEGHFTEVAAENSGINETRWTMDIGTADFNRDGRMDLYMANDFGPDRLYINQGDSRFKSLQGTVTTSLGRDTYKGMNASTGDIDNNGYPDVYISNVHAPLQAEGSLLWMNSGQLERDGPGAFRDWAWRMGVLNERRFGWGAAMVDMDLDGRLDLVQANGHIDDAYDKRSSECEDYWYWNDKIALTSPDVHGYADTWAELRGRCIFPEQRDRIYLNRGDRFVDVATQVGWTEKSPSRGVGVGDFDSDGDPDLLITHQMAPPTLWRNTSTERNWIGLALQGNGEDCNRNALGSSVTIEGDRSQDSSPWPQRREVKASNGFSAQGESRLLMGLGAHSGPVSVTIRWCGETGTRQELLLLPNRYHRIDQAASAGIEHP